MTAARVTASDVTSAGSNVLTDWGSASAVAAGLMPRASTHRPQLVF